VLWAKLSAGPAFAAATLRSLCVFTDGFPVLSVHLSLGLAPHIGQPTDKICRSEIDFKIHRYCRASWASPTAVGRNAIPRHAGL
jgi:hypothetical protein